MRQKIKGSAFPLVGRLRGIRKSLPAERLFIGILLTEHIGDIIACEPVIPWLRNQHPAAFIVWVTRPAFVDLLKHHPMLDAIETIDSVSACAGVIWSNVFDEVFDLHVHRKYCAVFNREYFKPRGRNEIDVDNYFHHGNLLEAMSLGAGLPRIDGQPNLTLPKQVRQMVDELALPETFVVIHAHSNVACKNWDEHRWNELVKTLVCRFGFTVVEVGLVPAILKNTKGVVNFCGKLSLTETAEVIRRATHFIGVDSGPAHLANAFQIPSLILLGHFSVYQRYMPYSGYLKNHADTMLLHWKGPASEIPVAKVLHRFEMARLGHSSSVNG